MSKYPELWTAEAVKACQELTAMGLDIVGGTGHRPPKLGLDYSPKSNERLTKFLYGHLLKLKPEMTISGLALGFDQCWAHASVLAGIRFVAAVPFPSQTKLWPAESRRRYDALLVKAYRVVEVCRDPFSSAKMMARNDWIVAVSTRVLSLLDENGQKSGTADCVGKAIAQAKPVINLWSDWVGV